MSLSKIIAKYNNAIDKRPLLTKIISAVIVFGIGDYLCQEMENRVLKLNKSINWTRVFKQGSFGIVVAPYVHIQFCKVVPYLFPENMKYSFLLSVFYASTLSDGIFNYAFFVWMHFANTKIKTGKEPNLWKSFTSTEVWEKFVPVQFNSMKVWPFMTGFNFYFMPIQLRVLTDNIFCIFWNIYLSYAENNTGNSGESGDSKNNDMKNENVENSNDNNSTNTNSIRKRDILENENLETSNFVYDDLASLNNDKRQTLI